MLISNNIENKVFIKKKHLKLGHPIFSSLDFCFSKNYNENQELYKEEAIVLRIENAYYYTFESKKTTDTIPKGHILFLLSTGRTNLITVPVAKTLHSPRKDYQLIYMYSGSLHYFDKDGTAHIAPPGSFVLYKPYEHQEFYITSEEKADKYWCHFDGIFVDQLLKTYNLFDKRVITVPPKKRYRQLFKLMRNTLDNKPEYCTELCSIYIQELIITIGSELKKQNDDEILPESIKTISEYIQNHHHEKITIEKLSKIGATNPKTRPPKILCKS